MGALLGILKPLPGPPILAPPSASDRGLESQELSIRDQARWGRWKDIRGSREQASLPKGCLSAGAPILGSLRPFSIPIRTPTIVHLPGGGKPPDVVGWCITRCWCRPRRWISRQDDKLFDKNRECFCAYKRWSPAIIRRASITKVTLKSGDKLKP